MCAKNNKTDNNKIFINDIFLLIVRFVIAKNPLLNLTLSTMKNSEISFKKDEDLFFKAGQLLMFFYVFSIDNLSDDDIQYSNGTFFVNLPVRNFNFNPILTTDSESIANDIINKSIYSKKCFPDNFDLHEININDNFNSFEYGFKECYKTFLAEKNNIVKLLENITYKYVSFNVLKNIKLLNPRDLKIQLEFLRIKFKKSISKNSLVEKTELIKNNKGQFINSSIDLLNLVNENSIIGVNSLQSLEITWFKYLDKHLTIIGIDGIYMSIYFGYIGKITNDAYYMQSARHSLIPIFHLNTCGYKKMFKDMQILKSLYLLNCYMDFNELNEFISCNQAAFDVLPQEFKNRCKLNTDELIFQIVTNNSINLLKSVILA